MLDILQKTLYVRNRKRFDHLREQAASLNHHYNGSNIVQDDIFDVLKNYASQKGYPLEIVQYPINDRELCACTVVRNARIGVLVNTKMELSRQIFAAAHELYHIYRFLSEEDKSYSREGSVLRAKVIDEGFLEEEDVEANAFAGLFLMPAQQITDQMVVYNINRNTMDWHDVVTLMHIFAVPYKAVVLRLLEENIISEETAESLLVVPKSEIERFMRITGKATRWNAITSDVVFGSLIENLTLNEDADALTDSRQQSDSNTIDLLLKKYGGKSRV